MEEILHGVVLQSLNQEFASFEAIEGQGMDNLVYRVVSEKVNVIVRLNKNPGALSEFEKETWCMNLARDKGLCVARALHVGQFEGWSYHVQEELSGTSANALGGDVSSVWQALGEFAAVVHSIGVEGVGREWDSIQGRFERNWKDWVDTELAKIEADSILESQEIVTTQDKKKLLQFLDQLYSWSFTPHLAHGDLSLNNCILRDSGEVYVIDWGNAVGHLCPAFDFAEIELWNGTQGAADHFRQGYGIRESEYEALQSEMFVLKVWRALWCLRRDCAKEVPWKKSQFAKVSYDFLRQSLPRI